MADASSRAELQDAPRGDTISAMCAAHGAVVSGGLFPVGAVFGDWRTTAFIGRGGSGEVYCAEHVLLGTPAAVKVPVRDEPRARERFLREAKLLSVLKSASFPQFYSYGEACGRAYLAMELLEPGDLPSGDRNVARFLLQICGAVAELHARGIVHRDIKPGNILWRGGTPVLADLGLAKDVGIPGAGRPAPDITIGGVGTPGYGAPEQMERGEATAASDIHALGVLADTCFGGNPPGPWKRIIERATSSIPGRRYQSVVSFARAIKRRHLRKAFLTGAAIALPLAFAALALSGRWMRAGEDDRARRRLPEQCMACGAGEWMHDNSEDREWRAMCSRGEIASVVKHSKPIYPDRPFPAIVRYVTNRVEGTIVKLSARTNFFDRPIRLKAGEYRIVGPGRLHADISGPSGTVVRLRDCIVYNTTARPYPENGIRYVLEDRALLVFPELERGFLPPRHIVITDGARNAYRFKGGFKWE